jgi:hypothetical protein
MDLGTYRYGCIAGRRPRRSILGGAERATRRRSAVGSSFGQRQVLCGERHAVDEDQWQTITVNERRVSIALGDGDDVLPRRPTSAICAVV